ncbi:hypothetical protein CF327_g5049 [Tilletia walkeri]|nr:hypothetical protein CF327_g5049 [Tilletia walkeri]
MFAPARVAAAAAAAACASLRPAIGERALSTAASYAGALAGPSRFRPTATATLPSVRRSQRLHTTSPTHFDAQSLTASAGDEGARVGAVLTAFKRPAEGEWEGGGDPSVVLTRRCVERLQSIAQAESGKGNEGPPPQLALRLAVEPGGCHGYQYKIELTEEAEDDDFHFQAPTPRNSPSKTNPLPILIDSTSLTLLKGATIDYVTELIGSQFAIRENPQAKGSGCGCGISWEPAV